MKARFLIVSFGLMIICTLYFLRATSKQSEIATDLSNTSQSKKIGPQDEGLTARSKGELDSLLNSAKHHLVSIVDFDITHHVSVGPQGFYKKYITISSNIEIRDPDGKVIYKADADNPFVGIETIEGGEHVAVNRGDGRYRVINTKTLESIDLPPGAPVNRLIGFSWSWFDVDTLVGVSGIGYAESAQSKGSCCDQHVVAASLLYLFDIGNQDFDVVDLPAPIKGLVFTVGQITQDGFLELISSGHEDEGKSLGWFQILPK